MAAPKHPCNDSSHGCDLDSTFCAETEGTHEYTCPCKEGFLTVSTSCVASLSPTAAPTATPTVAPTAVPTFHPCDDGSHSCDTGSTECTKDESSSYASEHDESSYGHGQEILRGYSCACLEGFVANLATPDHDSCMATPSPTLAPTHLPTFHPCDDGSHSCDTGSTGEWAPSAVISPDPYIH